MLPLLELLAEEGLSVDDCLADVGLLEDLAVDGLPKDTDCMLLLRVNKMPLLIAFGS